MKILKYGSRGPSVSLLQLALNRSGTDSLQKDGIFGLSTKNALMRFQSARGLVPDGIAGRMTHRFLLPWYRGYLRHKIRPGDTFYSLAARYKSSVEKIKAANPGLVPENLPIGAYATIPLPFNVVPEDIPYFSELISYCCTGLAARYPFIKHSSIGSSVMAKPLHSLIMGKGDNRLIYSAGHHANEWITCPVILKFAEELAEAYSRKDLIFGEPAADILNYSCISLIPAINPDGIDLETGELNEGPFYSNAAAIASNYPEYPFPSGWRANINGTDLNLQYPAGWERAEEIKYAQGINSPAPGDFVGYSPLSAPESRALYDFTLNFRPSLILAYHSQGQVIYWKYSDCEPYNSEKIARLFADTSGYSYESTPYGSGFAGYKDWFIQAFNRPGYTIEVGKGKNPLPISDFAEIYRRNLGILTMGAIVT